MEQESPASSRTGGCGMEGPRREGFTQGWWGKMCPRDQAGHPARPGDDILKEDLRIKLAPGQEFIAYII